MNPTTIDWPGLTHTWNPGYGCLRGCSLNGKPWCYAKALHDKRMKAKKEGKKLAPRYANPFNEMHFFPQDLKIVKKSRVVKKVFVGSMTDICYWKPNWMQEVLDVIRKRPEIEFMFLTKNPERYSEFDFPANCQLGWTVTTGKGTDCYAMASMNKTFLSIEPLLGSFENTELRGFDLVIVGAMTGPGAVVPKKEWIKSIKHPNIHYKENIKKFLEA